MRKLLLVLMFIAGLHSAGAQSFNLKELLTLKDHDIEFFHHYVRQKGYSYERSKYDERKEQYAYVYLKDIAEDLHEIKYAANGGRSATITFETTDVKDYEQVKAQLELMEFKFVKYISKQQQGRPVLVIVYSDGNTTVHLYNAYIEDEDHALVRFYKIKVL